ncbi:MAG: orotate phosphoribosyltransferase [Elusimicrobia bacterium]|nr:orotate phosphoribosyltransferase [Elusimicrobiota bacterium]
MMSSMNNLDLVGLLQEHGAIASGHFQLPSGFHSQSYVQTSILLQYPHIANKIARAIAEKFPRAVDVVLAPSNGSIALGQELARVKKARSIFAERVNGVMMLKHSFALKEGEKVLIVDDVITTGKLTGEAVSLVQRYGAAAIGIAGIVDRSSDPLPVNVPVRSLINYPLQFYTPEKCPLCAQNIPLTLPGSPLKPLE